MKKLTVFVASLLLSQIAFAQIITTVAGIGGVSGFGGDGGPATAAKFALPQNLCFDQAGNLYIADFGNSRVRMVNPSGIITTIVGNGLYVPSSDSGLATAAEIGDVSAVAMDSHGNLYICAEDYVLKLTTSGIITPIDSSGETSICIDKKNNIYLAAPGGNFIREINATGVKRIFAGIPDSAGFTGDGGPATKAKLFGCSGVTVDTSGNVYIADFSNDRIRKVDTAGIITTFAGGGTFGFFPSQPAGVCADKWGNLFIAEQEYIQKLDIGGSLSTIAGTGAAGYSGDGGPAIDAKINDVGGLAVDNADNLYLADYLNNRIRKISSTLAVGNVSTNTVVKIYPNPATNYIVIDNASNAANAYVITDMLGRAVLKGELTAGVQTVDISVLTAGSYIFTGYKDDARNYNTVFVKQ